MRGPTSKGESMTDQELVEILTLTCETDEHGVINYRNSAGELHRVCGPAVIYPDGSEWWYQQGQIHREDGPAVIYQDGDCQWWLNGQQLTEYEWRDQVAEIGTTF